jgi:tRNA 2-thiocytidine biosynthesis protein TtcA
VSQLKDRIRREMVQAISDFALLQAGDRVLVAVSGGKDSAVLLALLGEVQKKAPFPFSLTPVILDQKQPGFQVGPFRDWVRAMGHELVVLEQDTYSVVVSKTEPGKAFCGLCSRLRRGILYTYAKQNGYTKIALGHHRDDLNVTLLLNAFFSGSLASMPPKLHADDGHNVVIRPLAYVAEKDLALLADALHVPVIPCNLCGSQANLQRARIRKLLQDLEVEYPRIADSLLGAQGNIKGDFLLDPKLWVGREINQEDRLKAEALAADAHGRTKPHSSSFGELFDGL